MSDGTVTELNGSTTRARGAPIGNQNGRKHGDSSRKQAIRKHGIAAIDGRTRSGKQAKTWYRYALEKKGGRACPVDVRAKIKAGAFYLWRALELMAYIVADARTRGTPINRRERTLPAINAQHDTAMEQWQRINDELELDKPVDLARRWQLEQQLNGKAGA